VIVAPETEQSAASHALSLHRPLRLREVEDDIFAVDGTPADCVYVALYAQGRAVPRVPDLVVSGLNHGLNLGQDVFYSGTVAAAREGALRRIPALAASAHVDADFVAAADACALIGRRLLEARPVLPNTTERLIDSQIDEARFVLLNVNFPPSWKGQFEATRLGTRVYDELVDFRRDPRGREYFWIGGPGVRHNENPGSDTDAYDRGMASITSLVLDLTDTSDAELVARLIR